MWKTRDVDFCQTLSFRNATWISQAQAFPLARRMAEPTPNFSAKYRQRYKDIDALVSVAVEFATIGSLPAKWRWLSKMNANPFEVEARRIVYGVETKSAASTPLQECIADWGSSSIRHFHPLASAKNSSLSRRSVRNLPYSKFEWPPMQSAAASAQHCHIESYHRRCSRHS